MDFTLTYRGHLEKNGSLYMNITRGSNEPVIFGWDDQNSNWRTVYGNAKDVRYYQDKFLRLPFYIKRLKTGPGLFLDTTVSDTFTQLFDINELKTDRTIYVVANLKTGLNLEFICCHDDCGVTDKEWYSSGTSEFFKKKNNIFVELPLYMELETSKVIVKNELERKL